MYFKLASNYSVNAERQTFFATRPNFTLVPSFFFCGGAFIRLFYFTV